MWTECSSLIAFQRCRKSIGARWQSEATRGHGHERKIHFFRLHMLQEWKGNKRFHFIEVAILLNQFFGDCTKWWLALITLELICRLYWENRDWAGFKLDLLKAKKFQKNRCRPYLDFRLAALLFRIIQPLTWFLHLLNWTKAPVLLITTEETPAICGR